MSLSHFKRVQSAKPIAFGRLTIAPVIFLLILLGYIITGRIMAQGVERTTGRQPGDKWLNPVDQQRYVWIPPGQFTMGCSGGDLDCLRNETPAKGVAVTKGFWLGETTVTVGAWKRYRTATGRNALPTALPGRTDRPNGLNEASGDETMLAVLMTWTEAWSFCKWAGRRLPTSAPSCMAFGEANLLKIMFDNRSGYRTTTSDADIKDRYEMESEVRGIPDQLLQHCTSDCGTVPAVSE